MRFAGLFVGVDRHTDIEIDALSYAGRDAQVFWAAFADANEAQNHADPLDTALLVGGNATCESVRKALGQLVQRAASAHYDVVVLHFSCHGTPDGRLVLADARSTDLGTTSLPIAEITSAVRDLKAGCVVAIFESCFSGLAAGCTPDGDDTALLTVMEALADSGNRAILWAAGPADRAYETPRLRHGVLTHALVVEGLYGTLGRRDGVIDIARWVDDAVHRAEEQAAVDGRHQLPGRLVRITGTPTMPLFLPGSRRMAQLSEDQIHPVGADLSGLDAYGLDEPVVRAVRARLSAGRSVDGGPRLTALQQASIAPYGALAGKSLIVSGPTSCGKTLVGELAALVLARRRLKTAVLLPMRALAAEKFTHFEQNYGALGIRAVRSYGGSVDDDGLVMKGHFDVGFFTYEKFWLLALTNPRLLDTLGLVVVDEAHMIADAGRGQIVELILTLLRLRRLEGRPTQVIALSAALGETRGLSTWIDATPVTETTRPVPLREGVVGPDGNALVRDSRAPEKFERVVALPNPVPVSTWKDNYGNKARGQIATALVRESLRQHEQVLVFRASRYFTRSLALSLATTLSLEACGEALAALGPARPENDESRASGDLRECLENGVGFHISDLERAEREVVESAFRSGALRVLVATSGLAMGVNLPANTVIIADHSRRDERFTVSEYRNMAGRAGRWIGNISHGTSHLVAAHDVDVQQLWTTFIQGEAEPLVSKLANLHPDDLALVLMSLRPTPITTYDLVLRAAATFGGYQRREDNEARSAVNASLSSALARLVTAGLVRLVAPPLRLEGQPAGRGQSEAADRFELTEYGLVCGQEGLRAESGARVLRGAAAIHDAAEPLNEIALIALAQTTCELDELLTPAEDATTVYGQDELSKWHDESQLTLGPQPTIVAILRDVGGDDGRYLKRLKRLNAISMWVRGLPLAEIENAFTMYVPKWKQANPDRVSGAVRGAAERTADVLRAVGKLVALRFPASADSIRERVVALLPRLEHGVVREATTLMRMGLGIRRGVALQLIATGIATPAALFDALERDDNVLYGILSAEGVHRMRAAARLRSQGGRPAQIVEARESSQRRLFERVGDATAL